MIPYKPLDPDNYEPDNYECPACGGVAPIGFSARVLDDGITGLAWWLKCNDCNWEADVTDEVKAEIRERGQPEAASAATETP
jgi:hypothetical protein